MGPEVPPDGQPPGAPPEEESDSAAEGHRVGHRHPDGPVIDEVMPLLPPEREHHGG